MPVAVPTRAFAFSVVISSNFHVNKFRLTIVKPTSGGSSSSRCCNVAKLEDSICPRIKPDQTLEVALRATSTNSKQYISSFQDDECYTQKIALLLIGVSSYSVVA
jgi:hypothetical protein